MTCNTYRLIEQQTPSGISQTIHDGSGVIALIKARGKKTGAGPKIAALLNGDYRALQVALLRERAQHHRGEAMTLECGADFLSAEQRAAIDWHERQARALHHEAELIDKGPRS